MMTASKYTSIVHWQFVHIDCYENKCKADEFIRIKIKHCMAYVYIIFYNLVVKKQIKLHN